MLLDQLFGSAEVDALFSPSATVQFMLDFERALARAEAEAGVIPESAARAIAECCHAELYDLSSIVSEARSAGNAAIPMVRALTARVAIRDKSAASCVHVGATSQDVLDTALVLALRQALEIIATDLALAEAGASRLARKHDDTVLVARTWLQHAVPTTLGLKVAGWVDAFARHRARLAESVARDLVLQSGGAGGTLASLGNRSTDVAAALSRALELPTPPVPWHAHRDRVVSIATTLALLAGTLGKVARDIALSSQQEIGELTEAAAPGRGASSTMPHKRNPVGSAVVLAASVRVPALVGGLLSGMVQEHERGLGGWQAEWESLPEAVRLTAGAVRQMGSLIEGLVVHPDRMKANLDSSLGLPFSETAAIALGERMGRAEAREAVETACAEVIATGRHLRDVLGASDSVRRAVSTREIEALFDPAPHVAAARRLSDRVLGAHTQDSTSRGVR